MSSVTYQSLKLFTFNFKFQWKLCVISLLCGAYLKWAFNHNTSSENSKDGFAGSFLHYALQIEFYIVFLLAAIGEYCMVYEWWTLLSPLLLMWQG